MQVESAALILANRMTGKTMAAIDKMIAPATIASTKVKPQIALWLTGRHIGAVMSCQNRFEQLMRPV
jgi:hypothetical protein